MGNTHAVPMTSRPQQRGGGPKKINTLFEVYKKHLRAPQRSVTAAAAEIIQEVLGIDIPQEKLEYSPQTHILRLRVHGIKKSEVFLKRDEILTHLKSRFGTRDAPTTIL
jgi:hypothetical protein